MNERPIEMLCVPAQVCEFSLRAVRPKDVGPKETRPRTKSTRPCVQCAAAKIPAEITNTARHQW